MCPSLLCHNTVSESTTTICSPYSTTTIVLEHSFFFETIKLEGTIWPIQRYKVPTCTPFITTIEQGEQIAVVDSDTILPHNRLRHMSEKGMRVLHSNKVLPGLKCVNMDLYESFQYGKWKRVSFVKTGKENKKEKLELVHTEVWGLA